MEAAVLNLGVWEHQAQGCRLPAHTLRARAFHKAPRAHGLGFCKRMLRFRAKYGSSQHDFGAQGLGSRWELVYDFALPALCAIRLD